MARPSRIEHEFVEFIPEELAEGTLYISTTYATAMHLCLCGCGERIVTPLTPTDWRLTFDGETVSLDPSIGNWSYACQSHYWIERNRVHWAERWSRDKIQRARARDRRAKQHYYGDIATEDETGPTAAPSHTWMQRIWQRLRN